MVILLVNSYLKIKVEDYFDTETGMGAHVGRNANRIKGACVNIEGVDYKLNANEGNNNLHSGFNRSHCQMYYSEKGADDSGEYVEFHRVSPHLEQGFPGDLEQTIRYTLTKNNELMIDYVMSSDKTTIVVFSVLIYETIIQKRMTFLYNGLPIELHE